VKIISIYAAAANNINNVQNIVKNAKKNTVWLARSC
jgi:hypothetical protein